MDDDVFDFMRWEGEVKIPLVGRESWDEFLSRGTLMAMEIGAFMWGVNLSNDKQIYRQYTPFSLSSPVLGPFSVQIPGSEPRYDLGLPLKQDYDLFIQHMNRYRKVLRWNRYFYMARIAEQPGGTSVHRSMAKEVADFEALRRKWGSKIVRRDTGTGGHKKETTRKRAFDFNPIIRIPIKGV
jgi:hypothetical protein